MALHGESEFDVFAIPVLSEDGTRVRYDGYATFVEGHLCITYALVNGAPYLTTNDSSSNAETVRCIPSSQLPFDDIIPAINEATPIPSASIGGKAIECEGGTLLKTSFGGIRYAICSLGPAGFTAYASDVTIDVNYLENFVVKIPKTKSNDGSACETLVEAIALTPTGLALVSGSDLPIPSRSRKLMEASHMSMLGFFSCSCNSARRPCLFIHGLGNEKEEEGLMNSSPHFGWDKIQDHAPCCTSIKYVALNTVDYGWTSPALQRKLCNRSLSISPSSDALSRTIEDTIVVTHSMGGLMFAGALANAKCHLAPSSTWVALSPPMFGSMASDHLVNYCKHNVENLAAKMMFEGKCPASKSTRSIAYTNEKYSSKKLDAAYDAAQVIYRRHVFAAMCSSSYVGNISKYQFKYIMGGSMIPHKSSKNDGLVEFLSCAGGIPPSKFGNTPHNKFYRCELNHADTAFKTGDGIFKSTVRPVTWFECLL
uniref:Uncharacterized protein n=1 Tax=Hyaloperonospora arabidopsidis (strain Emoy2) TaxID=559515 RepID=M4B339_HYAAE